MTGLHAPTAVVVLLDVAAKIVADGYEAQYEAIDVIRDALEAYGIQLASARRRGSMRSPDAWCADWAGRIRDQRDAYVAGWKPRVGGAQ